MATKSFGFKKGDPNVDTKSEANVLQGDVYTGSGDPPLVTLMATGINPQFGTTVFAWIVTQKGFGGQDMFGVHVKIICSVNIPDGAAVEFALYQDGLNPATASFPWPLS